MADAAGRLDAYTADPRTILPLDEFHVPHRLARVIRQGRFEIRINTAFPEVIRGCARRSDTWISTEIIRIYEELHRRGWVHSVEAWQLVSGADRLCGGLYGVALGGAFCGESMFYEVSDASKVCTVALVERLRERGYRLLDCQMTTRNTARFGARSVPLAEFRALLVRALALDCHFA